KSLERLGDVVSEDELLSFSRRSGLRSGGLPIGDGYNLAILGNFVHLDENQSVSLTGLGRDVLARSLPDEPGRDATRMLLSALLLRYPPAWVAYWQGDPSSLDLVLPDSAREFLQSAEL